MGSIWEFPVCSGNERLKDENDEKLHNTQKPEALLYRVITLFTKKGDLVLDPFGGTMTTGVIAKKCGRNYTMIERDEKYVFFGKKRLDKTVSEIGDVENAIFDQKPGKVSVKEMVNEGYLFIGEDFVHKNGKRAKLVDSSGKLQYENSIESMHEIAAKMMGGSRRVNAFDYLYVERNGLMVSIYDIRNKYRIDHGLPLEASDESVVSTSKK